MATDMITSLATQFGTPVIADLGKRFGIAPGLVKAATPMLIGLVVAGVRRLASQPGGLDNVAGLLQLAGDRVGDRSLDDFVMQADPGKTGALLNQLTGSNATEQVLANLAGKTGLDPHAAGQLMGVIAPAVLNQMGAMAKEQDLDVAGLVNLVDESTGALDQIGDLDYVFDNVPGISDDIKRGFDKLFGTS